MKVSILRIDSNTCMLRICGGVYLPRRGENSPHCLSVYVLSQASVNTIDRSTQHDQRLCVNLCERCAIKHARCETWLVQLSPKGLLCTGMFGHPLALRCHRDGRRHLHVMVRCHWDTSCVTHVGTWTELRKINLFLSGSPLLLLGSLLENGQVNRIPRAVYCLNTASYGGSPLFECRLLWGKRSLWIMSSLYGTRRRASYSWSGR